MERIFLGWERGCLEAAGDSLVERYGGASGAPSRPVDLRHVIVALPGARAGRRLLEVLVDACERRCRCLLPPTVVTPSVLGDLLLDLREPIAAPLARALAWAGALRSLDAHQRGRLLPHPPGDDDLLAWSTIAAMVARAHRELAAEDVTFDEAAVAAAELGGDGEAARLRACAAARDRYLDELRRHGLGDPHDARRRALAEGRLGPPRDIVLVAVADLSGFQRRLLDACAPRVTALVHAPEELSGSFDPHGALLVEPWLEADIPVSRAELRFANRPADQAAAALERIAATAAGRSADAITTGALDPECLPLLEEQLRRAGLPSHSAPGRPVTSTAPARLVAALAEHLEGRRFRDLAALLRHPDVEGWLLGGRDRAEEGVAPSEKWLADLDRYHEKHLPGGLEEGWPGEDERRDRLRAIARAVDELSAPLLAPAAPLHRWAEPIREWLGRIYEGAEAPERDRGARLRADACERIAGALDEIGALPPELAPGCTAATAIRLLLASLAGETLAEEPREGAIEILGWLELELDDAPLLVVTGLNEGRVPESTGSDPLLPEPLRRRLGLPHGDRRAARDALALSAILGSDREVTLIAGRRSAAGDPLLPSRLLFRDGGPAVAERVHAFFEEEGSPARPLPLVPGPAALPGGLALPRPEPPAKEITSLAVTAFRDYIACPYGFYLRHVLGLDESHDRARELDGLSFGSLAHDVLADFGRGDLRHSDDADEIRRCLDGLLDDRVKRRHGRSPLPAVRVQIEQLRGRLEAFAAWQAAWVRQGWRIEHAEVTVSGEGARIDVDGEPFTLRGRIDRIDRHAGDGRLALLDYKTGEKGDTPRRTHQRGEEWVDLQLPLYRHLARGLGLEGEPALGYIVLPRALDDTGAKLAEWSAADLEGADARARDVIRDIRKGVFWPPRELPAPFRTLYRGFPEPDASSPVAGPPQA